MKTQCFRNAPHPPMLSTPPIAPANPTRCGCSPNKRLKITISGLASPNWTSLGAPSVSQRTQTADMMCHVALPLQDAPRDAIRRVTCDRHLDLQAQATSPCHSQRGIDTLLCNCPATLNLEGRTCAELPPWLAHCCGCELVSCHGAPLPHACAFCHG